MFSRIKYFFDLIMFKRKWRTNNSHNKTRVKNIFPIEKVNVKKGTYGELYIKLYSSTDAGVQIGNYCSIAENVSFLLGGEHPYKHFSTYPFKVMMGLDDYEAISKGKIVLDDDVWIGYGCTILSGVHIHQGAIIAAESVVYRDVPPYAIYGNGKIIKYRFSKEIINQLLRIDFSIINEKLLQKNIEYLYKDIDSVDSAEKIVDFINELK